MSKKIEELEKQLQIFLQELQELKKEKTTEPRFVSQTIIWDTSTDLEWLVGPDKDTTWDEANDWVKTLGNGWRMPTIEELRILYQPGVGTRNIDPTFATTGYFIWSDKVEGSSEAWNVNFHLGREDSDDRSYSGHGRAFGLRARRRG